ncbi:methyltransferase [Kitasatospora sp. NBC_01250]|uniref:methyltransferase n=1 Tax=unclassified Kitasatospora TaxID=2633591 RepID=UPI002E0E6499|nr:MULTISPECIES: methyltransferase [unclassified Kitasatospora]WSJ66098.1 methyltransferase [Kitasatospora sp. NBC_01302]
MNRFTTSSGDFQLTRFPEDPREQLRAWDAADEYLLRHLHGDRPQPDEGAEAAPVELRGTVVVLGDRWGALSTVLAASRPEAELVQLGDSYLAQQATRANLARAGLAPDAVRLLAGTETPPARIDVLLVRVPKSLALLEDQLHRLAPAVHPGTLVVGTGMVTEIHTSTLQLFERILGPTRTSLAVKKARLIFCTPDPALVRPANPWPLSYALPGDLGPASGRTVVNHGGIFCAERLDIGTRFLLQHLPARRGHEQVVDLGCGNGIVGTAAALANPEAEVTFIDESFAAVASAEATFRANTPAGAPARFQAGDALAAVPAGSVDLVLNNPPFHSHQATTDATAWRMFTGARRALRPGGELWVVGNRHLGYHVKLRRLFGNCRTVAGNPKFVILCAVKRSE